MHILLSILEHALYKFSVKSEIVICKFEIVNAELRTEIQFERTKLIACINRLLCVIRCRTAWTRPSQRRVATINRVGQILRISRTASRMAWVSPSQISRQMGQYSRADVISCPKKSKVLFYKIFFKKFFKSIEIISNYF